MPFTDFKKEPTAARAKRIWLENKGNWLLATGVIVSILAWTVGYFDLIPDITAVRRPSTQPLLATGRSLIVRVTGCESDAGQVVAMLYDAEHFAADSVPIRVELLRIEKQQAVWPIHNLHFGTYVVLAFHDVNGDEQFNAETERQGISHREAKPHPLIPSSALTPNFEAAFEFDEDKEEVIVELRR